VLDRANMVISGQSDDIVPGDRATYALRDVTGTVEDNALIAASVMSKKIALGTDGVVLDVKAGAGALVTDLATGRRLAETMVEIGRARGLRCRAVITQMDQPLGRAVGNAVEVAEALAALRGEQVPGFTPVCRQIARLMLLASRPGLGEEQADREIDDAVGSGAALEVFRRWVIAQGGDPAQIDRPELLPRARERATVLAPRAGWIADVRARAIGDAAVRIGAGRLLHGAAIDHAAGVVLHRRVGDPVDAGEPLAEVRWNGGDSEAALASVRDAFDVVEHPVDPLPDVHQIV
jgi:thymidine phosphorylase